MAKSNTMSPIVQTNYLSGLKYNSGISGVGLPIDEIVAVGNDVLKQEADNLKGMEDRFKSYMSATDSLLNIRIDNDYQKNEIDKLKQAYNLNDAFVNSITADDLKNSGVKVAQLEQNVKGLTSNYIFKKIIQDQAKADKYLEQANEVYAQNPALGVLAQNDYYEKYLMQKEPDYLGFPLAIDQYKPMDVMKPIDDLLKTIPDEYELQVDENSPNGYYFINKISKKKLDDQGVKDLLKVKISALRQNAAFDNNLKALIGANNPDGSVSDETVIENYINDYIRNVARDKVVDVQVKEDTYSIEKMKTDRKGMGSGPKSLSGGATTEKERTFSRYYGDLENRYPGYDMSSVEQDIFDAANGYGRQEAIDPATGDLVIKYYAGANSSSVPSVIRIKKKTAEQLQNEKNAAGSSGGPVSYYAPNTKGFVPADENVTVGDVDFGSIAAVESNGDPSMGWHEDGKAIGQYGLTGDNINKFLEKEYKYKNLKTKNQIRDAWEEASKDPGFDEKQRKWIFDNIHKPFIDYAKTNLPSLDPGVVTYLSDMAHQHGPTKAKELFNTAMDALKKDKDKNVKNPLAILKYLDDTRLKAFPDYEERYNQVYDNALSNASPKAFAIDQIRFSFKPGAPTDTVDPMDISDELLSGVLLAQSRAIQYGGFTNEMLRNVIVSSLHRTKDNRHSKNNPDSDHIDGDGIDFSVKTDAGRRFAQFVDKDPEIKKYFFISRHGSGSNYHLHMSLKDKYVGAGNMNLPEDQRGGRAPVSPEDAILEKFKQDSLSNSKNSIKKLPLN